MSMADKDRRQIHEREDADDAISAEKIKWLAMKVKESSVYRVHHVLTGQPEPGACEGEKWSLENS